MRNLEPGDEQTHARSVERGFDGTADLLRDVGKMGERCRVHLLPVIDLLARHDQDVALGHRLDGEECDRLAVLPHESTGQFSVDDLGEYRCHEDILWRSGGNTAGVVGNPGDVVGDRVVLPAILSVGRDILFL